MPETGLARPEERPVTLTHRWRDVRCPKCGRLLFRAAGLGTLVETKCRSCKELVTWPSASADMGETH